MSGKEKQYKEHIERLEKIIEELKEEIYDLKEKLWDYEVMQQEDFL